MDDDSLAVAVAGQALFLGKVLRLAQPPDCARAFPRLSIARGPDIEHEHGEEHAPRLRVACRRTSTRRLYPRVPVPLAQKPHARAVRRDAGNVNNNLRLHSFRDQAREVLPIAPPLLVLLDAPVKPGQQNLLLNWHDEPSVLAGFVVLLRWRRPKGRRFRCARGGRSCGCCWGWRSGPDAAVQFIIKSPTCCVHGRSAFDSHCYPGLHSGNH
mmetsp:Transcript_82650/g.192034  ORF Transcript_82650/g.192034 Transcript_82650/m.192034 type:complete len:212 (+) Transcript_82650:948-1583(+)